MSRDFNKELVDNSGRNYAYGFDLDVMHPLFVRSILPFIKVTSNVLELGSSKGDFTKLLFPIFKAVTCVEAASEAVESFREKHGNKAEVLNSTFEELKLKKVYDNIILTHVLEHLDHPVEVLAKINDNWLSDTGRFFVVCPNANAPSRQIAVKMGLITHNAAVTSAEREHGHRITYSLDTLERDLTNAGLKVVHRSGIFFKALANFQWDQLLNTDIITDEYLEGCYQLGQIYPDLCSSIFFVCEKGVSKRSREDL